MTPPRALAALVSLILSAQSLLATDRDNPPDTVLFNGKIFTGDASHPYVQALAIRRNRILATGTSEAVRALAGPKTRLTNLGGHTVIPGINDAHQHLSVTPPGFLALQLKSEDPPWPEVRDAIQSEVRRVGASRPIVATIGPAVLQNDDARRVALD